MPDDVRPNIDKTPPWVKRLLTISALYVGAIGLALVIVPVQFGVDAVPRDAAPELVSLLRLLGGPFLGIAMLNWLSRNTDQPEARTPMLVANLIGFGVVAVNDTVGVLTGDARDLARVFVIVHLAFATAFAIAWLRRPPASSEPGPWAPAGRVD